MSPIRFPMTSLLSFVTLAAVLLPLAALSDTATWIGGTGNWTDAANWSTGIVPNDAADADPKTDVVIDGNPASTATVTLTSGSPIIAGALTVDEGDSLSIRKSNNGSQNFRFSSMENAGTIQMSSHASGNAQNTTVRISGGVLWNKNEGSIQVSGVNSRNRTSINFRVPDNSRNDGTITITQVSSDRNNAAMNVETNGVFTNNGVIRLFLSGNYGSSSTGVSLSFSDGTKDGVTSVLGTGTLILSHDETRDTSQAGYCKITGATSTQVLTNGPLHTMEGGGSIDKFALVNEGLVRASETNWALSVGGDYTDLGGKALVNRETGRMVAISNAGLFLGSNTSKPSQFLNEGLLEARTGSFIQFRKGATHSNVKGENQIPAQFQLGGSFAGGGRIVPPRPVTLLNGSVVSPGDLSNTDGTGASTAGTLTFATNLVLSTETTLDFQFGRCEAGGYDAVVVEGSLTLAGTLRISALNGIRPSGTYRIFTCNPGELTGDETSLVLDVAQGVAAPLILINTTDGTVDAFFPPPETVLLFR